jgi:rhodanese-related sulfurtransferase
VTTVAELLADARASLTRLSPVAAQRAMARGAALVDIRSESQVAADGAIPGAWQIARNVLEWRLDPESPDRIDELARPGKRVIVVCHAGFQSSLAAATLRRFRLDATDMEGGFEAWRDAGLPFRPAQALCLPAHSRAARAGSSAPARAGRPVPIGRDMLA